MAENSDPVPDRRAPSAIGERVESERPITVERSAVTAWCPYEGTADFYTVRVENVPDAHAVELMNLRDHVGGYRGEEIGHEALARRTYEHLLALLEPAWLRLVVEYPPRYGLETTIHH